MLSSWHTVGFKQICVQLILCIRQLDSNKKILNTFHIVPFMFNIMLRTESWQWACDLRMLKHMTLCVPGGTLFFL